MAFTADAVEHSQVAEAGGELQITAPKSVELMLKADDVARAARQVAGRPVRVRITFEDAVRQQAPLQAAEGEVDRRALEHPEVRRFRELFGGEVRQVRNLKE